MEKQKIDYMMTLLKLGTYTILGTAGSMTIQYLQDGVELKEAVIFGIITGCLAGVKNILKHQYNIDLDLTKLKQPKEE